MLRRNRLSKLLALAVAATCFAAWTAGCSSRDENPDMPPVTVAASTAQPAQRTPETNRLVILAGLGHSQIMTGYVPVWVYGATVPGAFMIRGNGPHGPQTDDPDFDYASAPVELLRVEPGADTARATVGLSLGHLLKRFVGDRADVLVVQQQHSGAHLRDLSKGGSTGRYEVLMRAVDRAVAWGRSQGYADVEVHHYILQGHRYDFDRGLRQKLLDGATWRRLLSGKSLTEALAAVSWEEVLTSHAAAITEDVRARTGQAQVYLFHDLSEVPDEYRTAAWFRDHPNAVLIGTRYQLPYSDEIHLTPEGTLNLGALYAKAISESPVFGGQGPETLHIASAIRDGTRLTLSLAGGEGVLDMAPGAGGYYNLRFSADGQPFDPGSIVRSGDQLVAADERIPQAGEIRVRLMRRDVDAGQPHVLSGRWGYVRDSRGFDGWIYQEHIPTWDPRQYLDHTEAVASGPALAGRR